MKRLILLLVLGIFVISCNRTIVSKKCKTNMKKVKKLRSNPDFKM
jgi:hypothetical protein